MSSVYNKNIFEFDTLSVLKPHIMRSFDFILKWSVLPSYIWDRKTPAIS